MHDIIAFCLTVVLLMVIAVVAAEVMLIHTHPHKLLIVDVLIVLVGVSIIWIAMATYQVDARLEVIHEQTVSSPVR